MTPTPDVNALIERLSLHLSWRDSHGELNDAPNEAAQALRTLQARVGEPTPDQIEAFGARYWTNVRNENAELRLWARTITKAIMRVSGGGSEMTTMIGENYYADPERTICRIEEKMETLRRRARTLTSQEAQRHGE